MNQDTLNDKKDKVEVIVYECSAKDYPQNPPFNPNTRFPEYPFKEVEPKNNNYIYSSIRDILYLMGLDAKNFGKKNWNPFGNIIHPGQKVVIKPNLVISEHPLGIEGINASVVHGSIIRPIVDYVYIALGGYGKITIADSPIKEVDFSRIVEITGIKAIKEFYATHSNIDFEIIDFRDLIAERDMHNIIICSTKREGDPSGYKVVDLGKNSFLSKTDKYYKRYRSTAVIYENVIQTYHNPRTHKYSIPQTILDADLVISIAKLKTHQKAGVTLSLKNMVGITNEKRWLPHHRFGPPEKGGDSYHSEVGMSSRISELLSDIFMRTKHGEKGFRYIYLPAKTLYSVLRKLWVNKIQSNRKNYGGGDWYDNDTIWRMILDLNAILLFSDRDGIMQETKQRRTISFIDGIVGGDGDGPLHPEPKRCGLLFCGFNPVAVDIVASYMMGYDYLKIPTIANAIQNLNLNIGSVEPACIYIRSNKLDWDTSNYKKLPILKFNPPSGWKEHIELQ